MGKKWIGKRILPIALATTVALSPVQVMAASSDLNGHWAKETISEWQEKGLIKGYADSSFKPDNQITRAEFVTVMNNALGLDGAGSISFTDVKASDWFYNAVATAVGEGYCKGYDGNVFKPNATITRAEAAVMLANAAGLTANATGVTGFTDEAAIPTWAMGSIGAVVKAGFMSGYPDGSFGAAKSITRAEAVSSLNRVMDGLEAVEAPVEVPEEVIEAVVVTEDDTVIENDVITGDLIIDEAVGEGEVYLNDVVVEGNIIVNGGGNDSVYLNNVDVKGKIHINKKGVRVHMSGSTRAPQVEVNEIASITSENFDGEVGTITIVGNLGTGTRVIIDVTANMVVVDGKASVAIQADVKTVEITEDAENTKVEVAKNAMVETIIADAVATITGSGEVGTLEANVDGIKVSNNVDVTDTEVADGVSKPTSTGSTSGGSSSSGNSGSGSGGSGSSGSGDDNSEDNVPAEFAVGTVMQTATDYVTNGNTNIVESGTITLGIRNGISYTTDVAFGLVLKDTDSIPLTEAYFIPENGTSTTAGSVVLDVTGLSAMEYDVVYKEAEASEWKKTGLTIDLSSVDEEDFSATITGTDFDCEDSDDGTTVESGTVTVEFDFVNYTEPVTFGLLNHDNDDVVVTAEFTRANENDTTGVLEFDITGIALERYEVIYLVGDIMVGKGTYIDLRNFAEITNVVIDCWNNGSVVTEGTVTIEFDFINNADEITFALVNGDDIVKEATFTRTEESVMVGSVTFDMTDVPVAVYDVVYRVNVNDTTYGTGEVIDLTKVDFVAEVTNAVLEENIVTVEFTFENYIEAVTFGLMEHKDNDEDVVAAEVIFERVTESDTTGTVVFDVTDVVEAEYEVVYLVGDTWWGTDEYIDFTTTVEE